MSVGLTITAGVVAGLLVSCGIRGAILVGSLDRAGSGFLLGALLGPFGLRLIRKRRDRWAKAYWRGIEAGDRERKEQAWREWRGY